VSTAAISSRASRPSVEPRYAAVWIALVAVVLVGLAAAPSVVASDQVPILLRQAAPLGLLAIGQTVLIIARGFDLSVGGVVAMVNVLAANAFAADTPAFVVALALVLFGLAVGAVNGILIAVGRVPALVATLGMGFILSGATVIYTGGAASGKIPPGIRSLSGDRLLGLPFAVWIWLAVGLVVAALLRTTWLGRHLYARGQSPAAARLAGVRVVPLDVAAYVFSGGCAALGGLLLAGFVGTGTLGAGQDLLLGSLAAAVIGGATFEGGRGRVVGALGGATLLTVLGAILTGVGAGASGNYLVQGCVLLGAAALFRARAT
jgi:ribose transport system permease protein